MSNAGQAAISIGGAVLGFVLTGGNPAGAAWGYQLDTVPGAQAFPAADAIGRARPRERNRDVERIATIPLV